MGVERGRRSRYIPNSYPAYWWLVQACLVATLSYFTARLGGALILRPQMVSPFWLANVVLVAVLLLVRREIRPVLLGAGLAGFLLFDIQAGTPIPSTVWLILSNALEVLTALLCLTYAFDGVPRLNSVKALAKYSFYAVFLAPFVGAFPGALSARSNYWTSWKMAFLSEALGFLILMPAILGWVRDVPAWLRKPRAYYMEATTLLVSLLIVGDFAFTRPGTSDPPVLFYSFVPLLLWSTLRFGSTGVSTSMVAIAFVSIWGAVHGHGPFTAPGRLVNVLSLQMYLFFTAGPFMALAALAEEHLQSEEAIRESEGRFRLVANTAPVLIWMSGTDRLCTYFNQPWLEFTGRPIEAELGNGWTEGIYPEDFKGCLDTYAHAFDRRESFQIQYRLRRYDGEYRWLSDIGVPRFNSDRSFAGYIGSCTDITEAKLAQEALANIGRKLIEAHEEERAWIARELHDDINQRIALLAIKMDQWNHLPESGTNTHNYVQNITQGLSEIGKDIQALSHRLHSSKLEYLGLVAAGKSFCRELSEQHQVEIDFSDSDIPRNLPKEISLCLFRVLQEAVQNAVKHSGERQLRVELQGALEEIELTVKDHGVGFEQQDAINRGGLGLISMRERIRLVGGEILIKSWPGTGTTIHARVPLSRATTPAGWPE
jgi:PAS domain S-box-containing protein